MGTVVSSIGHFIAHLAVFLMSPENFEKGYFQISMLGIATGTSFNTVE
jgi:hypothetical protein